MTGKPAAGREHLGVKRPGARQLLSLQDGVVRMLSIRPSLSAAQKFTREQ